MAPHERAPLSARAQTFKGESIGSPPDTMDLSKLPSPEDLVKILGDPDKAKEIQKLLEEMGQKKEECCSGGSSHAARCPERSLQAQWDDPDDEPPLDDASPGGPSPEKEDEFAFSTPSAQQRRHERLQRRPRQSSDVLLESNKSSLKPIAMMKAPKVRKKARKRFADTHSNAATVRQGIRETIEELRSPKGTTSQKGGDSAGSSPKARDEPVASPPPVLCRPCVKEMSPVRKALHDAYVRLKFVGERRWMLILASGLFIAEFTHWARHFRGSEDPGK